MTDKNKQSAISKNGDIHQYIISNFNLNENSAKPTKFLHKTEVYELFKVYKKEIDKKRKYKKEKEKSKALPAELNEKLSFNNAQKYIDIFESCWKNIQTLELVLKSQNGIDGIEHSLRYEYLYDPLVKKENGSYVFDDGDEVLKDMKYYICKTIESDKDFDSQTKEEEIKLFADALLGYCTGRCKILENPNKKVD